MTSLRAGDGCEHCRQSGYRVRVGIFELLIVNDAIRDQIQARTNATDIRAEAVRVIAKRVHNVRSDEIRLRDGGTWRNVIVTDDPPFQGDEDDAHPEAFTEGWHDAIVNAKHGDEAATVAAEVAGRIRVGVEIEGSLEMHGASRQREGIHPNARIKHGKPIISDELVRKPQ